MFGIRNLGLNNLGLSGRGGPSTWWDKMWASYVQLNPGTYSNAVATEFKNRCKPDYVDSAGVGYYYNTFGPSGLNKTTADWIYLLTTSYNVTARAIGKSGSVIKWNYDGTIIVQNNLPAYTKGVNAGIVTMTSTDGWEGVSSFEIRGNKFYGTCPTFKFANSGVIYIHYNLFSGNLPNYTYPSLVTMYAYANQFSGSIPTYSKAVLQDLRVFDMVGITDYISSIASNTNSNIDLHSLGFTTAVVDRVLSDYNTMFAATPPIKNLTLNLSGATMAIPTGGENNSDLLGIMAKFSAAGFTASIIIRTS